MSFLLTTASVVTCTHGAPATTTPASPRVLLSGAPAVVATDPNFVAGCPFNVSGSPMPCVKVQWMVPATRVLINGQPAVLSTSVGQGLAATQAPQGPPIVSVVQPRVKGM